MVELPVEKGIKGKEVSAEEVEGVEISVKKKR